MIKPERQSESKEQQLDRIKRKRWGEVEGIVDRLKDTADTPIDPEIKELVIALNVLGFRTDASWWGRVDNFTTPYVKIASKLGHKLEADIGEYWRTHGNNPTPAEDILDAKRKELASEYIGMLLKLVPMLDDFYRERPVSFMNKIIARRMSDSGYRLEPQAACVLRDSLNKDIKMKVLRSARKEMKDFGAFLKESFFNPKSPLPKDPPALPWQD